MENNYNKVAKVANEGYALDFGLVFEKSFDNFKKIWGIAGISFFLVGILISVVMLSVVGIFVGFSDFTNLLTDLNPQLMTSSALIGLIVGSIIFAGLFSPINAGFIKMAYLADTNQPFGINTIFDYFKTSHFKELFISASAITLIGSGLGYVLEYYKILFVGNIISILVSFFTILTIPLIIFSDLKAFEAITMSIKLVAKRPFILLALFIVALLFVSLGIFALCIGILFTIPFMFSLYYVIYKSIIPIESTDELDEIGISKD